MKNFLILKLIMNYHFRSSLKKKLLDNNKRIRKSKEKKDTTLAKNNLLVKLTS